jgi:hypothetical protein
VIATSSCLYCTVGEESCQAAVFDVLVMANLYGDCAGLTVAVEG